VRKWNVALIAAAAAVLAVSLAPVARADTPEPDHQNVQWMTCAGGRPVSQGRIIGARFPDYKPSDRFPYLQAKVTVTPCVRRDDRHEFAWVLFYASRSPSALFQTARYRSLRSDGTFVFGANVINRDLTAICLSTRESDSPATSARLDCMEVTWPGSGQAPRIDRHIPPDHPLVRGTAEFAYIPDPKCGTCTWP
jgi:hypothetical protein